MSREEEIHEYRLCGSRYVGDALIDWQGGWLEGAPNHHAHEDAVRMVKQGQENVRWEFRTVTYGPVFSVKVTAAA